MIPAWMNDLMVDARMIMGCIVLVLLGSMVIREK